MPLSVNDLRRLRDSSDVESDLRSSLDWFLRKITKADKSAGKALRSYDDYVSKIERGKMYLFSYLPETRDKLPYYDLYPVVIPLEYRRNGFFGINLHYIPPKYRVVLLKKLESTVRGDIFRLKYDMIKAARRFSYAMPCLKQYKYSRLKSRIREIPKDDWSLAALLPIDKFVKESRQTVHKESINKIKES